MAEACARRAEEKQAEDIVILDLRGLSSIADYFVICSGSSLPHLKAIRSQICEKLRDEHQERPRSTEGQPESRWVVLDFGNVIVHVFHRETRAFYTLEDLWSDAPRVAWKGQEVA
ncbi:MAG: ribosome silencing factor [Verrucomicrobiales bacterium]